MADYAGSLLYSVNKDIHVIDLMLQDDIVMNSENISYHAQQAAEKMIKNAIQSLNVLAPKWHDLSDLMGLLGEHQDLEITSEEQLALDKLSDYSNIVRYAFSPDISEAEARAAIKYCNLIASALERNGFEVIMIPTDRLSLTAGVPSASCEHIED